MSNLAPMNTESQGGEVHYDPGMHMLNSQTVQGAPRQTRVYRQVRTDAYEYFAEVKADQGLLKRLWPWWKVRQVRSTPWNTEDHHLTPTQRAAESLCNFGSVLGSFVSGSLGGMAVMTLLQIYLFNINKTVQGNDLVLVYYAPIALTVNRLYWGLTMIALSSAVSRSAWMTIVLMPSTQSRESLRPMAGAIQSLTLPTWSMVAVIAYLLAFILNIASSGNDSDLAYAVDRDPYFHSKPLSDEFRSRLVSWRAVNTVKCICLLVAWISVVLEWQPRTLARFAKQVAQESAAGGSGHVQNRDSGLDQALDNTLSRMRNHDGAEVNASQSKWGIPIDATNRLDTPRIKTNPTFQAAQGISHVTMYPSAADGM